MTCPMAPSTPIAWLEVLQDGAEREHGRVKQVGAGTCVSRKTIRSWVIKKSMPLVWLPPRSFISALCARKTYALWRGTGGDVRVWFLAFDVRRVSPHEKSREGAAPHLPTKPYTCGPHLGAMPCTTQLHSYPEGTH
jgi:hypothetical protein